MPLPSLVGDGSVSVLLIHNKVLLPSHKFTGGSKKVLHLFVEKPKMNKPKMDTLLYCY